VSDETCPACGEPIVRKLSGRGAVVSAGHEVDGPNCRLAAWSREVERRGLVRVVGRAAAYLYDRGLVEYGPFWLTVEQEMRDAAQLGREGGVQPPFRSKAPCRVKSAFAPRWAYEVSRAFDTVDGSRGGQALIEFVRKDENLQRAVEAAAMLAEDAAGARKAVAAVVRSVMQEVKGGGGGGAIGEKNGGGS
jgi:hypothetical protein